MRTGVLLIGGALVAGMFVAQAIVAFVRQYDDDLY